MDRSEDIAALLVEIRDQLREGAKQQAETLEFLRAEAAKTRTIVDRSVGLQEIAVQRQRLMQWLVLPLIGICVGVLGWLIFGH